MSRSHGSSVKYQMLGEQGAAWLHRNVLNTVRSSSGNEKFTEDENCKCKGALPGLQSAYWVPVERLEIQGGVSDAGVARVRHQRAKHLLSRSHAAFQKHFESENTFSSKKQEKSEINVLSRFNFIWGSSRVTLQNRYLNTILNIRKAVT